MGCLEVFLYEAVSIVPFQMNKRGGPGPGGIGARLFVSLPPLSFSQLSPQRRIRFPSQSREERRRSDTLARASSVCPLSPSNHKSVRPRPTKSPLFLSVENALQWWSGSLTISLEARRVPGFPWSTKNDILRVLYKSTHAAYSIEVVKYHPNM